VASDGDENITGVSGAAGAVGGLGGASIHSEGFGEAGDGSTSTSSQNNTDGNDGAIIFEFKKLIPNITRISSDKTVITVIKPSAMVGGNKIALSEDSGTGKNRIQASILDNSISLSDTSTKLTLGGMPLTLKQASNGNYVLHVYAISDETPTYSPDVFERSSEAAVFKGTNIDVFVANDGKKILSFDRLLDQENLSGLNNLRSNDPVRNTVMWLGVPLIANNDNVLIVSTSDSSNVDEFVTTYFMGSPFLVARQGSDYLLCSLFDDSNLDIQSL
jgi:hypothetical protein